MATTGQNLTWIELQCHGWDREGRRGTRALLNEAHKLLVQDERDQNIVYDPATGDFPLITTVDGNYRYNLPDDCWKLGNILIDRYYGAGYGQIYNVTDAFLTGRTWKLADYDMSGIEYYKILNVRSQPATLLNNARFTFVGVNPGNTNEVFKAMYWKRAVEITSDSVQHELPDGLDQQYLLPATVKLIQSIQTGEMETARAYIMRELKPGLQRELDSGAQGETEFAIKRAY